MWSGCLSSTALSGPLVITCWFAVCSSDRPRLSHLNTFVLEHTSAISLHGWLFIIHFSICLSLAQRGLPWPHYLKCPPNPLVTPFISFLAFFLTGPEIILFYLYMCCWSKHCLALFVHIYPLECKFMTAGIFSFDSPLPLQYLEQRWHNQGSINPWRKKATCIVSGYKISPN